MTEKLKCNLGYEHDVLKCARCKTVLVVDEHDHDGYPDYSDVLAVMFGTPSSKSITYLCSNCLSSIQQKVMADIKRGGGY